MLLEFVQLKIYTAQILKALEDMGHYILQPYYIAIRLELTPNITLGEGRQIHKNHGLWKEDHSPNYHVVPVIVSGAG